MKGPPEERIRLAAPAGREPAVGFRGGPAAWRRAVEGARVDGFTGRFRDGAWSFLFKRSDTNYAAAPDDAVVAATNERMRGGEDVPVEVRGPILNPPVWTWEVPVYFWCGGVASGASFAALACDLAGDEDSARRARLVALGFAGAGGPLLIADLGRPERFYNMLRIFKPRSPMSMGAWCLAAFSSLMGAAVGLDLLGRHREARAAGAAAAATGTYLGSYTAALLASTAVPVWSRSRLFLGPIFVSTAIANGAAATRVTLAATCTPAGHPTRNALGAIETAAALSELSLSAINERRLGDALAESREFTFAKWAVSAGLALRLGNSWAHHLGSILFLAGGLAFRFGWINAGKLSARDDETVAQMARA